MSRALLAGVLCGAMAAGAAMTASGTAETVERFVFEDGTNRAVLMLPRGQSEMRQWHREGGTVHIQDRGTGNSITIIQAPSDPPGRQ